jgi:hypothetical protein
MRRRRILPLLLIASAFAYRKWRLDAADGQRAAAR